MRLIPILVAFLVFALPISSVADGTDGAIEMFCVDVFDGTTEVGCCEASIVYYPGRLGLMRLSIQVRLGGATAAGISGVEFYIDGLESLPPGWMCHMEWNAGNVAAGHPCAPHDGNSNGEIDTRRANFAWYVDPQGSGCQDGDGTYVRIAELLIANLSQPQEDVPTTSLRVVAGDPPADPRFDCPLVTLCDYPVFTAVCVEGGAFTIKNQISPPGNPLPPDAAQNAEPVGLELQWENQDDASCIPGAVTQDVYLGTDPDPTLALAAIDGQGASFRPQPLQPFTTYFWRVSRSSTNGMSSSSPVWSFTTGEAVAAIPSTWARIKTLYR